jgi:ParB-like chromosome segregation protein Spo0J
MKNIKELDDLLGELFQWASRQNGEGFKKNTAWEDAILAMSLSDRVGIINRMRERIHDISPFNSEPVDFVKWVPSSTVHANDYNPNSVAPPEMELLRLSIEEDGYTQPIVTFDEGESREVVDGFHRHRVGKECLGIQKRIHGYLPVVAINEGRSDKGDRIAATIRHNRARGKHRVDSMSEIVIELRRRNWSDDKIAKHLGMDPDEVLRLTQISGLAEMFSDQEFSVSWDVENAEEQQIEFELDNEADLPHLG